MKSVELSVTCWCHSVLYCYFSVTSRCILSYLVEGFVGRSSLMKRFQLSVPGQMEVCCVHIVANEVMSYGVPMSSLLSYSGNGLRNRYARMTK